MKEEIKKLIKYLVPPILVNMYQKANAHERKNEYESYHSALPDCTPKGYEDTELCNVIADKTVEYSRTLLYRPFNLQPTGAFLLSAIQQYIVLHNPTTMHILDIGGACGAHYFEVRRFIPQKLILKWTVLETPEMVSTAKKNGFENFELNFISTFENTPLTIDFVHSSSTLQYVPNPYKLLDDILSLDAPWIFFNRMMFNENDREFVTIQKSYFSSNGPGPLPKKYSDKIISYPHTTLSFDKFQKHMLHRYDLQWIFDEKTGNHKINNEKTIGRGMLYFLRDTHE